MWGPKKFSNSKVPINQPAPTKDRQYPTETIKTLMDSDSEEEYEEERYYEKEIEESVSKVQRDSSIPFLVNKYENKFSRNENMKENVSYESNKMKRDIKYSCFRLDGQKLVESAGQHNSLNLEEASIIRDNSNEVLVNENERLKQELIDQRNCYDKTMKGLESENRALMQRLNLVREELETKDSVYEEIYEEVQSKNREVSRLEKKISSLQLELDEEKKNKLNKKRQGELSRFLSEANKQDELTTNKKEYEDTDKILKEVYRDVAQYLNKRVEEFKNNLITQKMSLKVEEILETFMTEIVNLNEVTVNRALHKNKFNSTPTRTHLRTQADLDNSIYEKSGLFKDQNSNRTPIKVEKREKTSELRNLEKSLHKLKEMEKSYHQVNSMSYNTVKDNYESLDRSSISILDRSKSRRKKIFE